MATANSTSSGPEPAAGLSLSLSSNNPFRNRAASPASPASPFDDPPPRPVSRNPFLDAPPPVRSPGAMSTQSDPKSLTAEDIFDSLTLDDNKNKQPAPVQRPPGNASSDPKRPENQRPQQGTRHRPTPSQEEAMRARKLQGGPPPPRPSNSPQRRTQRRPRRNSESSIMDLNTLTEEEKKMIEARRRERRRAEAREAASRDGKAPPPEGSSRESKTRDGKQREASENRDKSSRKPRDKLHRPSRRMDIIDQLDATSIYGTGLFHHDGPFDALNPHRNKSGRRAPMQAFPKDSMNMSLGGSGPLNKAPDHATFMGNHDDEAFRDWANSKKARNGVSSTEVPIFDPVARGEVVHGDESVGLGTSTFLEGTPAARAAIAQQAQEEATVGLQRKKSLAQRIRPFKGSREYGPGRIPSGGPGMRSPDGVQSAGLQGSGEGNPFFNEFGKGEESISVRREGAMSPTSPPPRRGSAGVPLERRVTTDATPTTDEAAAPKPVGFIGRMKSLKGGRRQKNPEPPADEPPSYPGTAV